MALVQKNLTDFRIQRERLSNMLSESSEVINELNMSSASENLGKLNDKINNDTFKIQVIGTFNNGKSTVINALLGENVLPAYAVPTTAVINEVKYGDKKEAILHFRNPLPANLPQSLSQKALSHMQKYNMENIPPLHIEYSEIEDYVVIPIGEDPKEMLLESPYEKVELFWPLPMLKEGVEIIDSPGLNESATRARVTVDYLSKADAILFVLSADRTCAQDEMEFIEDNLNAYGFTEPFFVVNKFDLIREQEKARVRQFAELKLAKFSTNGIYFISAQQALDGEVENKPDLYKQSGMDDFVTRLSDFLTKDKGKIKLSQPARELKRVLSNEALYKIIPNQRAMLNSSLDSIKTRYQTAEPQLRDLKVRKEQLVTNLRLKIEQSKHEFRRAANSNVLSISGMVLGWINEYQPKNTFGVIPTKAKAEAIVLEIKDFVTKKIEEQQKRWKDNVMIPLIKEKVRYIFQDSEQDLQRLYDEIDDVTVNITGGNTISNDSIPLWQRIAGAAGGILLGCPDITLAAGINGITKDLVKSVGLVLGTEAVLAFFLGITNPFVLIGGLIAAIVGGGFRGDAAMKKLKKDLGDEFSRNISSKAQESSDQVVDAISVKLVDISKDISSAIDNEINQAEQQVNGIIEEMKKGQANIDARKQIIAACETKIKEISTNLDAFTFELIEQ